MAHHGDPAADERPHAREHRPGALELDGLGARLLEEADGVRDRLVVGDLEGAERHVGDHERPLRAARDRAREHDHLVDRRGDGRLVAEHDHRGGVADEDQVDAGRVGEPPPGAS